MKDIFHVDMSGRIYEEKNIGIAVVGTESKVHFGCALKGNLVSLIKRRLFAESIYKDSAKLYAICISLIIKNIKNAIKTLIICNDEDFLIVKKTLLKLLQGENFEIISISDFRKELGRNIGSLADNYANIYRRRALKYKNQAEGKKLNVVKINFKIIKNFWDELEKKV